MLCAAIDSYLNSAKGLPFFYAVGDENYCAILDALKQRGVKVVRTSDFCTKDDKFPDLDEVIDYFRTADIDYRDNKHVLIGLGEYLAMRGPDEAWSELRRLKTTTLGNARVVLLLRGISSQVNALIADDARLTAQGRAYCENALSGLSATNVTQDVGLVDRKGVKWLLKAFEDGACHNVNFSSALSFSKSIFPISVIADAYAALRFSVKDLALSKTLGTDEQWSRLLNALQKNNHSLEKVFETYEVDAYSESDIHEKVNGLEFKNWLFFIYLKTHVDSINNSYLARVVRNTNQFATFKENILSHIATISHREPHFSKLYSERKRLVRFFPESDIASFVKENSIEPKEEIYRLTDNTLLEKQHVITWISRNGWNDAIAYVYPALSAYLRKYIFDCGSLSDILTDYFERYKLQKVENRLDPDFLKLVDSYGSSLKYTKLQTRDNAIKSIPDKSSAFLYWIDALGVEYLSYFTELARKKGLSMRVDIVRADLPTITPINKSFYDNWTGKGKIKEETLDDIKHHEKGGYFFTDCEDPIHIASELQVIERAVEYAAMELAMHKYKTFVITSDHGASRLAVLRKKEEKYETDTKGEHSGRCCKAFDNCDLEYKVEENGYFVLTDYGRFKGGRAANVEVHGGATLEEVVVPVITLQLKKQGGVEIEILNNLQADRKAGTLLSLYISDVERTNNVSLVINGTKYNAKCDDPSHYRLHLHDIKRSKTCAADVYDGDDLIGSIQLNITGKSGSVNVGFDSEFDDF